MTNREELARKNVEMATALKRRLLLIGITAAIVIGLFTYIQGKKREQPAPVLKDRTSVDSALALPVLDAGLLAQVRDTDLADQVVLEPEPFVHVATIARALLPALLLRLNEPAFPVATAPADLGPLRGQPYRMRGSVVESERITRDGASVAEHWTALRTDAGYEFLHVGVLEPERQFAAGDFVLADGYFFKTYSKPLRGERRALPLFVGRQLLASTRPALPSELPDPAALAGLLDPFITEDSEVDEDAMWHLGNVARTLRERPGALDRVFNDAPWLDVALLAALNETPEAFRGSPIRVAGFLSLGDHRPAGENPLREAAYSEAWVANSNFGDIRVVLRTPGRYDFTRMQGIWEFRGWFQQMWAYQAATGVRFRVPVFVFADARPVIVKEQPMVGAMTWILLVVAGAMAALLFALVLRDRARNRSADERLTARRRQRRQAGS
jgi:hypothetical protein